MLKKMLMTSLVAVMAFASTPSFAGGCRPCVRKPRCEKVCKAKPACPPKKKCKKACVRKACATRRCNRGGC
ncbi:MAG TPA: hypothetical protein VGT41_04550 [Candidatus Babeliales bacterium]|nr:hypothetical protein [Candidatus Babeliales bacterium]